MKITAKDVAALCDTSTAAVSRAFRTEAAIAPGLRSRILSAARELSYAPPAKRANRTKGRRTISIVVGDVSNPFYINTLETFSQAITARKHDMLVHVLPPGASVDTTIPQVLRSRSDAAIITSANLSSEMALQCKSRGMPVVLFNRVQINPDTNAVCADNYNGGILAAQRLLARGCKTIGFVGGITDTSTHLERRRGFLDELERRNTALAFERLGQYDYGTTSNVVSELLQRAERPDGLFCANDIMAIAAIDVVRRIGLIPGKDVSIIGFDDVPMAAWPFYQLTTIRQPIRRMVSNALSLIDEAWQEPEAGGSLRLMRGHLVERTSG